MRHRKLQSLLVGVGVAVMTVSLSLPANASSKSKLKLFAAGSATAKWKKGVVDSPLDSPNNQYLKLDVTPGDYAYAFANKTGIGSGGTSALNIRNLSFDFLNSGGGGYEGAGAPRISVGVDTGGNSDIDQYLYLSASYCDTQLITDPDWSRADFTGQTDPGCTIVDTYSNSFSSNGSESAWQVWSDANPGAIVRSAFIIQDEPGTAILDRIAFQNHMFVSKTQIAKCPTEVSC